MIAAFAGRLAARVLSPGGRGGRLSILIFHRVLASPDPLLPDEPDANLFRWQLKTLAASFNVVPLAEAAAALHEGTLPPRAACITFDDGYADNAEVALPLLREQGLTATFFIATGYVGGGRMFNDSVIEVVRGLPGPRLAVEWLGVGTLPIGDVASRRAAIGRLLDALKYLPPAERQAAVERLVEESGVTLPDNLMMSAAQVRELADAGMEVGAHTVTHPILTRIDGSLARDEIARSRDEVAAMTGRPVRVFAYPNGRPGTDYDRTHVDIVRELGFEAAVSTARGVATRRSDRYQLPRFTPWDRTELRFTGRLLAEHLRREVAA